MHVKTPQLLTHAHTTSETNHLTKENENQRVEIVMRRRKVEIVARGGIM